MAKKKEAAGKNRRILRAGPLTKLLLLVLLLGIGWQLYRLQSQVEAAQVEKDLLAGQVEAKRQENRCPWTSPPEAPRRRWRRSPETSWAWSSPASMFSAME